MPRPLRILRSASPVARDPAATAIANGVPLYTTNPDDFEGIAELEVVAVPHPDARADPTSADDQEAAVGEQL